MMNRKYLPLLPAAMILILLLAVSPASPALAAGEQTKSPRKAETITSEGGTIAWTNPGGIFGTGASSVSLNPGNNISYFLRALEFGFQIPNDAVIKGIKVEIYRKAGEAGTIRDHLVELLKYGFARLPDVASSDPWPTDYATATYGGPTDPWDGLWTPEEINEKGFGVGLVVTTAAGDVSGTAYVDSISITVYYSDPTPSTTSIDCGSGVPEVRYGESLLCAATVSRSVGSETPGGTVGWSSTGSGSFSPETCTLSGSDGISTCSVLYTPGNVGTAPHTIMAVYPGDANFNPSSGSQEVTVKKAVPTLSITNSPVMYNGQAQAAVVVGSVPGTPGNIMYDGVAAQPVEAGTYAVTADFTPDDEENYESLNGAPAGPFVIDKFPITVTAENKDKTAGTADPELTYTYEPDLFPGDSFTGMLDRQPGETPGTYAIQQGTLALPASYELIFIPGELTIHPTIEAESIKVQIDQAAVQQKQEFTAKIVATSTALYGVQVYLTYDVDRIEVTSLTLGGDLSADLVAQNEYGSGAISFAYTQDGSIHPEPAVGENLLLATITFKVKDSAATGAAYLRFADSPTTIFIDDHANILGVYPGTMNAEAGSIEIQKETTVSGEITLQGRGESNYYGTTLELSGVSTMTETTDNDGKYSFEALVAGLYDLSASYDGYLTAVLSDLELLSENYTLPSVMLLGGDANHDQLINASDLQLIASHFGEKVEPFLDTDINEDGETNICDLVMLGLNYTKTFTPWNP